MSKSNDWNSQVRQGTEVAGSFTQGVITANDSTPTALKSSSTECIWVMLQNIGSANVYFGGANVASSGADRGPIIRSFGNTPVFKVHDLSEVYVISASGDVEIAFLAGLRPTS